MVGVVGRGWRGRLELVPRLIKSLFQSLKIITRFRPELVIGVGGYASVPVLLAAKLKKIPYVIHEQNAFPGLSNRLLSRWASLIFLSLPVSQQSFGNKKTLLTGNPLRAGFDKVPAQLSGERNLLIFGGSRGAKAINTAVVEMLPILKSWGKPPFIVHQTGEDDLQNIKDAYAQAGYHQARVVAFIDDMAAAYADATLVICRAGATTLAELTACGRPAILIPFPYAAADHQSANAKMLEKSGVAKILVQKEMSAEGLAHMIESLLDDRGCLQQMADKGRSLGLPDAAERILAECRLILAKKDPEVD
jgi:UDP-N-acetylglucosamine--N-acetylmuramyl-(pentapeptide) pyrophosphoryl-undecaprenol N-acetylglucosamine transferase